MSTLLVVRIQPVARRAASAVLALGCAFGAHAQSEIYKCVDDQGHTVFQNIGRGKQCERLAIDPVVTVPGTRASRPADAPRQATPANFPRIDGDTQRSRESDRRRILEEELQSEQERLGRLRSEYNEGAPALLPDEQRGSQRYQERVRRLGEEIERSRANVASLQRELAPQRF